MNNRTKMETKAACTFICPLLLIGGFKVKSFNSYSAAEDAQEIKENLIIVNFYYRNSKNWKSVKDLMKSFHFYLITLVTVYNNSTRC